MALNSPVTPLVTDKDTNLRDSLLRTWAPVIVGFIVALGAKHGLDIDSNLIFPVVTLAWYTIWRLIETKVPEVGWVLGMAKQPAYSAKDAPPAQPAPGEPVESNFLNTGTPMRVGYVNDDLPLDDDVPIEEDFDEPQDGHNVPGELLELHEAIEALEAGFPPGDSTPAIRRPRRPRRDQA